MRKWTVVLLMMLSLPAGRVMADEFRMGLGIFNIAGGPDLQASYRPEGSHWQVGYRYNRWVETFEDPFTGHDLTETTMTMTGPIVCYLLDIESSRTWYLGLSWLRWTSTDKSLVTDESDTESLTAPFFGGGYTGRWGETAYYNLGFFLSSATMVTETSVSYEETTGLDLQLQVGLVF